MEANFFATNLLMPEHLLDASGGEGAIGNDAAVEKLANAFDVSGHAMSLRLVNEYRRSSPF